MSYIQPQSRKNRLGLWISLGAAAAVVLLVVIGVVSFNLGKNAANEPTTAAPKHANFPFSQTLPSSLSVPTFELTNASADGWAGTTNPKTSETAYVNRASLCSFDAAPIHLKATELKDKKDDAVNSSFLVENSLAVTADKVSNTTMKLRTGGTVDFKMAGVQGGDRYRLLVARVFSEKQSADFFVMHCADEKSALAAWSKLQNTLVLTF